MQLTFLLIWGSVLGLWLQRQKMAQRVCFVPSIAGLHLVFGRRVDGTIPKVVPLTFNPGYIELGTHWGEGAPLPALLTAARSQHATRQQETANMKQHRKSQEFIWKLGTHCGRVAGGGAASSSHTSRKSNDNNTRKAFNAWIYSAS